MNCLLHGQVVRQLERGILQELEQLQEPGNAGHICWRTPYKPLVYFTPKPVWQPSTTAGQVMHRIMSLGCDGAHFASALARVANFAVQHCIDQHMKSGRFRSLYAQTFC